MELFIGLILLFLGGTASYGLAQLWVGSRDLWRQLHLWRAPSVALRDAREGRALVRGRVRAARKLLPALNRDAPGVVAYASRSSFQRSGEVNATIFEIVDGTGVARVEADHPVVVAPEAPDVFGALTREIRPGDLVTIVGQLERVVEPGGTVANLREPPMSLVVRDVPGAGVVIHRGSWQSLRTVGRGVFALAASALALWLTIGAIG
jgi:hypothetical protein